MKNRYKIKSLVDDMTIEKDLSEDEYELLADIFEELCIDEDSPIAVIEEVGLFPEDDVDE